MLGAGQAPELSLGGYRQGEVRALRRGDICAVNVKCYDRSLAPQTRVKNSSAFFTSEHIKGLDKNDKLQIYRNDPRQVASCSILQIYLRAHLVSILFIVLICLL